MKKSGRVKKRICITILCVFLGSFPWIWLLYVLQILPYTQKWFTSYDSFSKKTDRVLAPYPMALPSSAGDIRYFYYTGGLDTKTGISFTVSDEDYHDLKERNLSSFTAAREDYQKSYQDYKEEYHEESGNHEVEDWRWYVFNEKVTPDFLKEEKLEYLGEILRDKAEDYTILAYEKGTGGEKEAYTLQGIICNDETNEIVMFGFKDVLFNEKH